MKLVYGKYTSISYGDQVPILNGAYKIAYPTEVNENPMVVVPDYPIPSSTEQLVKLIRELA